MTDEQRELMRIAAQRVLDDHASGLRNDPSALAWARHVVAHIKPLGRPVGPGGDSALPAPLRDGALEVF